MIIYHIIVIQSLCSLLVNRNILPTFLVSDLHLFQNLQLFKNVGVSFIDLALVAAF